MYFLPAWKAYWVHKKKQCIVARESSCDSKYTTLSYKCIRISSTVCATKSCCFKKAIILFNISGSFKVADGWLLLSVHFLVVSRSSPLSIYKWNASKMIAHILFLWFQLQTYGLRVGVENLFGFSHFFYLKIIWSVQITSSTSINLHQWPKKM